MIFKDVEPTKFIDNTLRSLAMAGEVYSVNLNAACDKQTSSFVFICWRKSSFSVLVIVASPVSWRRHLVIIKL